MSESEYRAGIEKRFPLEEMGTRWQHYTELRDLFSDGVEVMKNSQRSFKTPKDVRMQGEMEAAVALINKRLEILAGFERKTVYSAELPTTLRAIEIERKRNQLLLKGKPDEKAQDSNLRRSEENPST
jgi:hypothetical protein